MMYLNNTAESMSYENSDEESKLGRMVDALAHGGDEGRDKLRQAAGRCK